jgi:hypothetical protein
MTFFNSDFDIFGKKKSRKQRQRETLANNKAKGKAAEDLFVFQHTLAGHEVVRTGRGHDFRVRKRNLFTGEVLKSEVHEVKSSKKAPLSKLQKKTKKKKSNYKVDRIEPGWF